MRAQARSCMACRRNRWLPCVPSARHRARDETRKEATMATAQSASSANPHGHRGWSIAWGIVLIVIGILALLMPGVAALATAITLGWLLVLAGVVELIHAFQTRRRAGFG